jgi:hypothetical protein
MEIYRKPTTDVMITNSSCHPQEHKLAAIKSWILRLITLPLNENSKRKELNTIINIALNNGYKENGILTLYNRLKHKQNKREINTEENKKWVTFTYTGNHIRKITKLFKGTNLKVAFKTTKTIAKLLSNNHITNTYEQSGIYNLTCQSCHKVYVGQMGRNLTTRFKERIRNIRSNKDKSAFAQHILNQGHQCGPMEQIMKLVEHARKGNIMNIKEDYYIYKFKKTK